MGYASRIAPAEVTTRQARLVLTIFVPLPDNNFLTLDLTKSWDTKTPILNGLPQPSGPPKVAMGYLWNDYNNLYLYGGQFADNPFVEPSRSSVWKYSVRGASWTENQKPETSSGNNSEPGGVPVQRSAEGAGLSVPELGLSWYFGGHLDLSTTPGWSNQIARVYLKSLLEFTHPGYANTGIDSLRSRGAGEMGAYRNITQGRIQRQDAFFERADGALVFIPGWGDMGVLIGLGGGTNTTFADNLGTLDVYDIARSEWYHQETSGIPPSVRVNLCAVVASAPDASSFQVHVFGGQNLEPYVSCHGFSLCKRSFFFKLTEFTCPASRETKYSTTTCTSSPSRPLPGSKSTRPARTSRRRGPATRATYATGRLW